MLARLLVTVLRKLTMISAAMDDGGADGGGSGSGNGSGSCASRHNRKIFPRLPVEARRRRTKTESVQGAILEETENSGDRQV